jgi:hypothetical protein
MIYPFKNKSLSSFAPLFATLSQIGGKVNVFAAGSGISS